MSPSVPGTVCFSGNALQLSTAGGFRSAVHTTAEAELWFSLSSFHPEQISILYSDVSPVGPQCDSSDLSPPVHQTLHQTRLQSSCFFITNTFTAWTRIKGHNGTNLSSECVSVLLLSILWNEINRVSQVWRLASCLLYCPTSRSTNRK